MAADVVHGLHLDGYNLTLTAEPGHTARLTFVADQPGMFRFRCSTTCGPLHPFMIGKLHVGRNELLWRSAALALLNVLYGYFVLPESLPPDRRRPFRLQGRSPLGTLARLRRYPVVNASVDGTNIVFHRDINVGIAVALDGGNGLPLGMQMIGRPFDEATVLRAGDAYQRATDWHTSAPQLS